MKVKPNYFLGVLCVGFSCFGAMSAEAVTVLVDFGQSTTTTDTDTLGRTWNNIYPGELTLSNAKDTAGNDTTINVVMNGSETAIGASAFTRTGEVLSRDWPTSAAQDTIYHGGNTTLTITGLTVGTLYRFDIYSARHGGGNSRLEDFTIEGLTTVTQNNFQAYNNTGTLITATMEPEEFESVLITIKPDETYTYMNALQITIVPEPASGLLSLVGMCGLLLRRKR